MKDLEDPSKTCIYIPPGELDEDAASLAARDVDDEVGYELRMEAYKSAWMKCLDRVRGILQALNAPIATSVAEQIRGAYDHILPGLPYPELPVVALCSANSALVGNIIEQLGIGEDDEAENVAAEPPARSRSVIQVHLYPADCSTVMNMMKALVTGFVDRGSGGKRTASSLANYDINLLRAWYAAQDSQPILAVFLHEFEKFDTKVVQDVLYICSINVHHLPLVFVLTMTSPPAPSFLHSTYTRSTLALLRVHQVSAPTGLAAVKDVLTKVFFDPDFEPDVMLGPGALEYISDFATRHSASPDALLTMLQLAHLKHFTHPLSVFVHNQSLGVATSDDAEAALTPQLADAVQTRLLVAQERERINVRPQNARELLDSVSTARVSFQRSVRRMRVAFAFARIAERISLSDVQGALIVRKGAGAHGLDSLDTLSAVLRGRMSSQVRYVCMAVRKLSLLKLRALLQGLHSFLYGLQSAVVRREEADARIWIVERLNELPNEGEGAPDLDGLVPQDAATKELAGNVGTWLQEYIEARLVRLEDCTLWDIWYTGASPFPSELINPAPRPTVVAALLHPHDFIRSHADLSRGDGEPVAFGGDDDDRQEPALWELPDTSIAFRRYIEAGRMVNVYDWFESFSVVLDSQRKHLKRRSAKPSEGKAVNGTAKGKGKGNVSTPSRRRRRRDTEAAEEEDDVDEDMHVDDEDDDMDEEEEERWKLEVQARFIRALHELDYMGFVKHTGRKPDHVIRTIYDVPD
ncbi:origin recognition complex subunit 3 N-terminus-domain-containing protein [Earliella scabrosa]|nr:origin recognition complex subunit 3 N-terminus-domain-containing protein [Earliella scabrosa]